MGEFIGPCGEEGERATEDSTDYTLRERRKRPPQRSQRERYQIDVPDAEQHCRQNEPVSQMHRQRPTPGEHEDCDRRYHEPSN
jgi:hypothetical protein